MYAAQLKQTLIYKDLKKAIDNPGSAVFSMTETVTATVVAFVVGFAVIAWLMREAEAEGDPEYFCYKKGLPYGYFNRAV
jgi:undecaprenyl pyrophosphate phosphatase UppP